MLREFYIIQTNVQSKLDQINIENEIVQCNVVTSKGTRLSLQLVLIK